MMKKRNEENTTTRSRLMAHLNSWTRTRRYRRILFFIRRLCRAVVGDVVGGLLGQRILSVLHWKKVGI
jgi:hypothetical protein